jgi:hypothetical protein
VCGKRAFVDTSAPLRIFLATAFVSVLPYRQASGESTASDRMRDTRSFRVIQRRRKRERERHSPIARERQRVQGKYNIVVNESDGGG